ncbi:MAG TPA: PAC2 family protein [Mycobacteriales bacterium]|nr:PAC2 family protein [Mycobacteriales bacterium]
MLDPHELYQLADEVPTLDRPVLVLALSGFVDAGGAARLTREHLLATRDSQPIATFDIDQLLDYRSRRPVMLFVEDHWESYDAPELQLLLLKDAADTPFLLLAGPEPDLQWERFTAAVRALIERFDVRLTISFNAIPMAVPHTRPIGVTAHATRPDLITGHRPWLQRVQVPGSVSHLLEFQLGQAGRDAVGFAVHVPHYLAQTDYPDAAEVLLESVVGSTGLRLPTDELRSAAAAVRTEIDEQVGQSDEVAAVVRALEEQYDAFVRGREQTNLLHEGDGRLPTAEELGAELERFLADQTDRRDQPGP